MIFPVNMILENNLNNSLSIKDTIDFFYKPKKNFFNIFLRIIFMFIK